MRPDAFFRQSVLRRRPDALKEDRPGAPGLLRPGPVARAGRTTPEAPAQVRPPRACGAVHEVRSRFRSRAVRRADVRSGRPGPIFALSRPAVPPRRGPT